MPKPKATPDIYKIVYFGASAVGKRTNLSQLQKVLSPQSAPVVVESADLSIELTTLKVGDKPVLVQTLSADCDSPLWPALFRDLHGFVFVVDSSTDRYDDNERAMGELIGRLAAQRIKIDGFPCVIQYNKRDALDVVPTARLEEELNPLGLPAFNAQAHEGIGVVECIKAVCYLIEQTLKK